MWLYACYVYYGVESRGVSPYSIPRPINVLTFKQICLMCSDQDMLINQYSQIPVVFNPLNDNLLIEVCVMEGEGVSS